MPCVWPPQPEHIRLPTLCVIPPGMLGYRKSRPQLSLKSAALNTGAAHRPHGPHLFCSPPRFSTADQSCPLESHSSLDSVTRVAGAAHRLHGPHAAAAHHCGAHHRRAQPLARPHPAVPGGESSLCTRRPFRGGTHAFELGLGSLGLVA